MDNTLYYGDNLEILRRHIPAESVDLVYLDPPFNSKADYNILFRETSGESSHAQITAFEDTWHWTEEAERTFQDIVDNAPANVVEMMRAFRGFIGTNDMMAYLTMMCVRLIELRRVLKPTGSIYLHCDPTASHYLKVVMDTIFGKENFRNEIVWKRTTAHGDSKQGSKHFGRIHDVILRYTRSDNFKWVPLYTPYEQEYLATYYKFVDENGRRYWKDNLTAAKPGGDTRYEWRVKKSLTSSEWAADLDNEYKRPKENWEYKGITPPERRYWAYSFENMKRMAVNNEIAYTRDGFPLFKRYLDKMLGRPVQDWWDDIRGLGGLGSNKTERLGFPTQKPVPLLERILLSSSNEGDVVLDPFCGCGTTITAAQKLKRRWIGIDLTHLAINLIKWRMRDMYNLEPGFDYRIIGEPEDLTGAQALAEQDKYQFQWWALSLINARPYGDKKKGKDTGIDGYVYFHEDRNKTGKGIVSVKGGNTGVKDIRDLKAVVEREKAEVGIFLTLNEPTKDMTKEAVTAGFYHSALFNRDYPKIQILTISELLAGQRPLIPSQINPHKRAQSVDTSKELPLKYEDE